MAKRPYVKFYVDDFFGSFKTQGMTTEQIGAYFLMLMAASQEQNIDLIDDDNYLGVITRLGKKFKNHSTILKKCFESENGRIYNVKLRKVLSEYDKFVENQRIKSAKGVSAKQPTGNPRVTQAEPVDNPTITNNHNHNHNQEPLNKEVANATKKGISLDEFRLLVDEALLACSFTEKFTAGAIDYFYTWAKTENKIKALRKIKNDLPIYFQGEIDYLSKKYTPNQIEYITEISARRMYVGLFEKEVPPPAPIKKQQFEERYSDPQPVKPTEPIEFVIPNEFK